MALTAASSGDPDLGELYLRSWLDDTSVPSDARAETIEEPSIEVFRREHDGSWKISHFLAYPIASQPGERVQ